MTDNLMDAIKLGANQAIGAYFGQVNLLNPPLLAKYCYLDLRHNSYVVAEESSRTTFQLKIKRLIE